VPRPKLFQRGDCRKQKVATLKKLPWVRFPVKIVSIAWKLSMTEQCKEQNCFGGDITGTKVTNPKTVLGSSLSKDRFRDHNFFCDI
jgi:hypothetical protein